MNRLDADSLEPKLAEMLVALEQRVRCHLNRWVGDFRLSLRGRGLVLQGHAHTYYAKQLAQHAVMDAIELPIRANEIEVV